jgi:ribosomal protein L7/L12
MVVLVSTIHELTTEQVTRLVKQLSEKLGIDATDIFCLPAGVQVQTVEVRERESWE